LLDQPKNLQFGVGDDLETPFLSNYDSVFHMSWNYDMKNESDYDQFVKVNRVFMNTKIKLDRKSIFKASHVVTNLLLVNGFMSKFAAFQVSL